MLEGSRTRESAAHGDEAAVDLDHLADLLGESSHAELVDHLKLFLTHFPNSLARIEAAVAHGTCAALVDPLHAAKGAAATAGAPRLLAVLQKAETSARSGLWPDVAASIELITREYDRVRDFVEKLQGSAAT